MTYKFDFLGDTTFAGKLGFLAEVYGGLEWSSGFALVGQFGLGGMKADSLGTSVGVSLVELSIRAQYAFMPLNKVRPVLEFGGRDVPGPLGYRRPGHLERELLLPGWRWGRRDVHAESRGRVPDRESATVRVEQQACQRARGLTVLFRGGCSGQIQSSSSRVQVMVSRSWL